ncbi:MAG: hypothetical protein MZV63_55810 [Marinilabiliales bacterium]|nr:hypothetical protein [Marinilabiliales bacterium]
MPSSSSFHLQTGQPLGQAHLRPSRYFAVKISDSVNYDRGVPQVFLTSSIHGDETTGYVTMMHLIDSTLNAYGSSTRIARI